ncbi:hypothetical protein [Roseibium sediminis]|uniref:hypothetical protein n=1 Tax=Roseibium sediminis TaxID=1775174 RepID=UPI00123C82B6|nr:hypothetical protein [Roseibium sediminis]
MDVVLNWFSANPSDGITALVSIFALVISAWALLVAKSANRFNENSLLSERRIAVRSCCNEAEIILLGFNSQAERAQRAWWQSAVETGGALSFSPTGKHNELEDLKQRANVLAARVLEIKSRLDCEDFQSLEASKSEIERALSQVKQLSQSLSLPK